MKIVKTYEAFINESKDLEPIDLIKKNYNDYDVKGIFDGELPNWVDDSVYQNFEDVCDWFYDNSIDDSDLKKKIVISVSDYVSDQLINWYEKESENQLSEEERAKLSEEIIKSYKGINPNNW